MAGVVALVRGWRPSVLHRIPEARSASHLRTRSSKRDNQIGRDCVRIAVSSRVSAPALNSQKRRSGLPGPGLRSIPVYAFVNTNILWLRGCPHSPM